MFLLLASLAAVGGAAVGAPSDGPHLTDHAPLSCRYKAAKAAYPRAWALKIGADQPVFHRLGDLPDADMEIAINRLADGCPAPATVVRSVAASQR